MIDYKPLYAAMEGTALAAGKDRLQTTLQTAIDKANHGQLPGWLNALQQLPAITPDVVDLQQGVRVQTAVPLPPEVTAHIETGLRCFHPWRKGPFTIHGIHIDTEWRSDWKWDRLKGHIQPLNGRLVLDVGGGNGYYGWRMVGAGARLVIGVDPMLLYVMQYQAVRHFLGAWPAYVLPLTLEQFPLRQPVFDTVFSLGVLYHRRSPFDHLLTLFKTLRPGGELILETLVIAGQQGQVLVPEGRYARMGNVWFIPSVATLFTWLKMCRFEQIRLLNVTPTTPDEQRTTSWMTFHSLIDFLDPTNTTLTVEGHPAPQRAILTAVKP